MATVTGITAERAQEIEDASVASGFVDSGSGHLILVTNDGTQIDAGLVTQEVPELAAAWPIGSIFMCTVNTSPNILLGGGTWVRWGQGRVPVSLDEAQTEFDGVEETGGAKTHVLTTAQLPVHSHGVTDPGHSHGYTSVTTQQTDANSGGGWFLYRNSAGATTGGSTTGISIQNTGSGEAHNNLQPYITCYMWKRTA